MGRFPANRRFLTKMIIWMWLKIKPDKLRRLCFHLPGQAILEFRFFEPQPYQAKGKCPVFLSQRSAPGALGGGAGAGARLWMSAELQELACALDLSGRRQAIRESGFEASGFGRPPIVPPSASAGVSEQSRRGVLGGLLWCFCQGMLGL